ncbi:MAG: NADP-specific glutamate dehydrogenase [Bacteroidota bacterium]
MILTQKRPTKQIDDFNKRFNHQPAFLQAITEVWEDVHPFIEAHPKYQDIPVFERLIRPDQVLTFTVPWVDDDGSYQLNTGFRVQMSSALGPYKGGLRFAPGLNEGVLKFLAFEQSFKNALTGLPLGSGKGGADFNPKGKSDQEIMRFCQAFITQLYHHIGGNWDVPAGDMGVGSQELGYLYGHYKRLTHRHEGVITGKPLAVGGIQFREEATGYGSVLFARHMLQSTDEDLEGKTAVVSGAGNVAIYTVEKLIACGATVLAMSDSGGSLSVPAGINAEKLEVIKQIKLERNGSLKDFPAEFEATFYEEESPWGIKADCAFPSATQNELGESEANLLVENEYQLVCEGANMPLTSRAQQIIREAGLLYGPGKAANAGGVAMSGMEMAQHRRIIPFTREEASQELEKLIQHIFESCVEYGKSDGMLDLKKGANVAGFVRLADAIIHQGW